MLKHLHKQPAIGVRLVRLLGTAKDSAADSRLADDTEDRIVQRMRRISLGGHAVCITDGLAPPENLFESRLRDELVKYDQKVNYLGRSILATEKPKGDLP